MCLLLDVDQPQYDKLADEHVDLVTCETVICNDDTSVPKSKDSTWYAVRRHQECTTHTLTRELLLQDSLQKREVALLEQRFQADTQPLGLI